MQISLIDKIRQIGSTFIFTEEDLFDQVAGEVANNKRKDGLWTKALSESGMNEDRAKALYIKMRVDQLYAEATDLLKKLRNEENAELIHLLEEAKKDRLAAAEELSKATQFKVEFDENRFKGQAELKSKIDDIERDKKQLTSKLEAANEKISILTQENKNLQSSLSKANGKLFFGIVSIIVILLLAFSILRQTN